MMKRPARLLGTSLGLVIAATIAACGGSDTPSDPGTQPAPPAALNGAEGIYSGTLSDAGAFDMLVLENGEFWYLYGGASGYQLFVSGLIRGQGTSSNGTFTSASATDFNYEARATTLDATYDTNAKTISGSETSFGTINFNGGPFAGNAYNYSTPASLSTITGTWGLGDRFEEMVNVSIAANGQLTGVFSTCTFTGSATPRPSGRNVFDVTITYPATGCIANVSGLTVTGVALPITIDGQTQLLMAATDSAKQNAVWFFGGRN